VSALVDEFFSHDCIASTTDGFVLELSTIDIMVSMRGSSFRLGTTKLLVSAQSVVEGVDCYGGVFEVVDDDDMTSPVLLPLAWVEKDQGDSKTAQELSGSGPQTACLPRLLSLCESHGH
jgi:hypothetical protein